MQCIVGSVNHMAMCQCRTWSGRSGRLRRRVTDTRIKDNNGCHYNKGPAAICLGNDDGTAGWIGWKDNALRVLHQQVASSLWIIHPRSPCVIHLYPITISAWSKIPLPPRSAYKQLMLSFSNHKAHFHNSQCYEGGYRQTGRQSDRRVCF